MLNTIFSFTILILTFIGSIIVIVFILRFFLHKRAEEKENACKVIMQITVPKESAEAEGENKEKKQEELKEKIAVIETLYANLGGIRPKKGWLSFWQGTHNYISLEIAALEGLIKFYLICPQRLAQFVEQQVHAQYPYAQIDFVEDYNIFTEKGDVMASHLVFRRNSLFPIKTYQIQETDPLNALTNTLSKIVVREGAAIQILIKPAKRSWNQRGLKLASNMQQGRSLSKAQGGFWGEGNLGAKALGSLIGSVEYAGTSNNSQKKDLSQQSIKEPQKEYKLSPLEEELVKGIENKASKFAYEVNIRIVSSSEIPGKAESNFNSIINAFAQYEAGEKGNGFKSTSNKRISGLVSDFIFRKFKSRFRIILSTEELTSLWHLPLPSTETPNILWLQAKKAAPPVNLSEQGIVLGKSVYRGEEKLVRLKRADRRRHLYIIGKSGGGKSVFISNLAIQDIKAGEGLCVLDPHGDLVESILEHIPKARVDDVIYFDPSDMERPIGLNMLEYRTEEQKDFAVQEMIAIFYKLFPPEMIGPMFEHNMRNVMLTLMADKEHPGTIADIPRMFTDKEFQKYKVKKLTDPMVRAFWEKEMAQTSDFHKSEMLGYLISKVGRFVENEMIRNIIGQPKSGFDFREVMDQKKILLINLSKGKTGEVNSSLLGLIIVAKLQMAALSRAELIEKARHDFYLYIDEFQNFITDSIATILSEARKYRLNLILAHQYLGQLIDEKGQKKILDAVLGNAGTMVSFRVGVEDAETIAKEFAPVFNQYDVINIERFNAYIKLLIDNTAARAFNIATFPPEPGSFELAQSIKELSRMKYGQKREEVEQEILDRTKLGVSVAKADTNSVEASL